MSMAPSLRTVEAANAAVTAVAEAMGVSGLI